MTQALYAHMNNKTIKIKKKEYRTLTITISCLDDKNYYLIRREKTQRSLNSVLVTVFNRL
jgi:hypothetical protein